MADRIIKGDSGNDVIIQNNDASRKIEVTNSGDVEVTGDVKTTTVKATNLKANDGTAGLVVADSTGEVTSSGGLKSTNVKATNLKANDGTASLEIADSTGDIGFSGNTNIKIKLPSAGGIYESDGSTEVLTESSGTATLKNTVIDGTVSMASSGATVRNISQVALSSDQSLSADSTLTTFFSPTYTPKFSGSKVMGCLTIMMYNEKSGGVNARKYLVMEFTGSDITNFTFADTTNPNIGGYDYGSSGVIIYYINTIMGPLLTTSGTNTITCNCKLSNHDSGSGSLWQVFGNNTLSETFFTWIEYK